MTSNGVNIFSKNTTQVIPCLPAAVIKSDALVEPKIMDVCNVLFDSVLVCVSKWWLSYGHQVNKIAPALRLSQFGLLALARRPKSAEGP